MKLFFIVIINGVFLFESIITTYAKGIDVIIESHERQDELHIDNTDDLQKIKDDIVSISISNMSITPHELSQVIHGKKITKIFFDNCSLHNEHFLIISKNPNIKKIAFSRENITDYALECISHLYKLNEIVLSSTCVQTSGFKLFHEKTLLKKIVFDNCRFVAESNIITDLSDFSNLECIIVSSFDFKNDVQNMIKFRVDDIKKLSSLKTLIIHQALFSSSDLQSILQTQIQTIWFENCIFFTDLEKNDSSDCVNSSIKNISLMGCRGLSAIPLFLKNCSVLENLRLDDSRNPLINKNDVQNKTGCVDENTLISIISGINPKDLVIVSNCVTLKTVEAIMKKKQVEHIHLDSDKLTKDEILKSFKFFDIKMTFGENEDSIFTDIISH